MKNHPAKAAFWFVVPALLGVALTLQPGAAQEQRPCWDAAKTQAEMNACAAQDLRLANQEMNRMMDALLERHKENPAALEKLKAAQEAWVAYRDATIAGLQPGVLRELVRLGWPYVPQPGLVATDGSAGPGAKADDRPATGRCVRLQRALSRKREFHLC